MVTSHNADLLDSPKVRTANVLAVLAENGNTRIGPLGAVGSEALEQQLHTAIQRPIQGAVDGTHTAGAYLLLQFIALFQPRLSRPGGL